MQRFEGKEETKVSIRDCVDCIARPRADNIIDLIHPTTGKTLIYGLTLAEIRQRPGDEKAEIMRYQDFADAKAERQDTPIKWEETTEEKFSYMLEVLPPAAMHGGGFLVGEPTDHHAVTGQPRFGACKEQDGKYYAANRPLTRAEFQKELSA